MRVLELFIENTSDYSDSNDTMIDCTRLLKFSHLSLDFPKRAKDVVLNICQEVSSNLTAGVQSSGF